MFMAKKKKDALEELKASAEKVWLAGLGALAQAEKQGDKLFRALVKRGKKYDELLPAAGDAVKDSVAAAKKQANTTFQELEKALDRQVEKAMKRAGLATKSEVDALRKEVTKLKKAAKSGRSSGKKTSTKKKGAAKKKTAAKKGRKKKA